MDVLAKDSQGNTPLHWACARGHLETVRQLEAFGAGAISATNSDGDKPIDCAKANGHSDIVESLCEEGRGTSRVTPSNTANLGLHDNLTHGSISNNR